MLINTAVSAKGLHLVLFKTTGHEQLIISLTLLVPPDGKKRHSICCLEQKELSERTLSSGIIFKCNEKGWMTEIMFECFREFWDRGRSAFLRKIVGLVLDAFKCHQKKWKLLSSNLNTDLAI